MKPECTCARKLMIAAGLARHQSICPVREAKVSELRGLRELLIELEDAVWCSRGDVLSENEAAKDRKIKAHNAILSMFQKGS